MGCMTWFPRLLGAATAGYGVAIIARPELFCRPTGLVSGAEPPTASDAVLTRAIGARDLVSGIAMALAPAGWPLRTAIGVRVGADIADVVVLGAGLPDQDSREKATMASAAWGALCALSVLAADRGTRRRRGAS